MSGPFILMYHSISDDSRDPYSVSIKAFQEQLSWLFAHGFEVVPLSFLVRSLQTRNNKVLRKKVVITFDDGYKDFFTNALPILHDLRASATVFLVTDMFGGRVSWSKSGSQDLLMSEDEVSQIKAKGISLGSHTATHANLTILDSEEMKRQLVDSHDTLTRLGESFYAISYPWGQWSSQVIDAVESSGYECALAVGERTRVTTSDIYRLPRIAMSNDMEQKRFQSFLTRTHLEMEIRRIYGTFKRGFGRWNDPGD
jgi:peptidoglycan/xylan/chitin deacetylase (PgdA/CDA1 family)